MSTEKHNPPSWAGKLKEAIREQKSAFWKPKVGAKVRFIGPDTSGSMSYPEVARAVSEMAKLIEPTPLPRLLYTCLWMYAEEHYSPSLDVNGNIIPEKPDPFSWYSWYTGHPGVMKTPLTKGFSPGSMVVLKQGRRTGRAAITGLMYHEYLHRLHAGRSKAAAAQQLYNEVTDEAIKERCRAMGIFPK